MKHPLPTLRLDQFLRMILRGSRAMPAMGSAMALMATAAKSSAATRYWDGTGTDWSAAASWSTVAGAASPDPGTVPGANDDAYFSTSNLTNTAQSVYLNATQAVRGMVFLGSNAGTTTLMGGGTNRTLNLGRNGIAVDSGSGAVAIGSAAAGQGAALALGAAQSWTNNSANALTVFNGVNNGGNLLTLTGTGFSALNGVLEGSGGLTRTGGGTSVLAGANSYTGLTTISAGVLRAAHSAALGAASGGVVVSATGAALELDGTAGALAIGAEPLTLNGSGLSNGGALRNLAGDNRYGGTITLAINSWINSDAGTLTMGAIAGATRTLTISGSGNAAIEGIIATGTGGLTKRGTGALILSGANTYAGTTGLSEGTLRATTSASALGTGSLAISGGVLELAADSGLSFNNNTTLSADAQMNSDRLTNGAGVTHTLGTLSMGAQTLTIGGGSKVTSGTAGITFGSTSLSANGATFTANLGTLLTLGAISPSGAISRSFAVNGAGNTAIEGIIGTGLGNVTKSGSGTLTLSGVNTYAGITTLAEGVLSVGTIGNGGVAGNLGTASSAASKLVFSGGTLRYTGGDASTDRNFTVNDGTSGTIEVNANTLTMIGVSSPTSGALSKTGQGTLVLAGANGHTGLTSVLGGSLRYGVDNALATGAVTVNGGILDLGTFSDSVGAVTLTSGSITGSTGVLTAASYTMNGTGSASAVLGGAGGLTKSAAGTTTTLSGANRFTGPVAVRSGALRAAHDAALGAVDGGVTVDEGAALELDGSSGAWEIVQKALTINGNGINLGGALRSRSGANRWAGALQLAGDSRVTVDAGSLTLAGPLSGNFGLVVGGPGRLKLTGASNGSTTTALDEGATLQVGDGGSTGLLGSGEVTLGSGSNLEFRWINGTAFAVGNAIGGGGAVSANGGIISLTGANTYTGATAVSSGVLEVAGSGKLSGTGSVSIGGGTFLLSGGAEDRVNDAAGITLGGGSGETSKLEISGNAVETFGALTLSGGGGVRVIDFGSGSGVLTFGSLASTAMGIPLHIWNWTGNIWTGGGTDQLKIASGVLGANILLSDITIFSDSGDTLVRTGEVVWGSEGELVAIPEASSVLATGLMLSLLAWKERRQWSRGAAAPLRGAK